MNTVIVSVSVFADTKADADFNIGINTWKVG